jgi:hypothetical protein
MFTRRSYSNLHTNGMFICLGLDCHVTTIRASLRVNNGLVMIHLAHRIVRKDLQQLTINDCTVKPILHPSPEQR